MRYTACWLLTTVLLFASCAAFSILGCGCGTSTDSANSNGAPPSSIAPATPVDHDPGPADKDPDGDSIASGYDKRPWVADVPSLQFTVSDIKLGIAVEAESTAVESALQISARDFRQTDQETEIQARETVRSREFVSRRSRGGGGLQIAGAAIPISYSGYHRSSTYSSRTTNTSRHIARKDRLSELSQSFKALEKQEKKVTIPPKAGYLQIVLHVRNRSTTSCELRDFGVNLRVNGVVTWNLTASQHGFRPRTLHAKTIDGEDILLRLDGINTLDVVNHVSAPSGLDLTIDVPPSTIETGFADVVTSVLNKCALVEVLDNDGSEVFYVSTVSGDKREISLDQLLRRLPGGEDVSWAIGPKGDYLDRFKETNGCGFMLPDVNNEGSWFLFHESGELTGKVRDRPVRPGEHVRIQHATSHDYWGADNEWVGFVDAYDELRFIASREHEFWTLIDSVNENDMIVWDAKTQLLVRDQARELTKRYRDYFESEQLPSVIQAFYPNAMERTDVFEQWFCNDEVRFPTYNLRVKGARIWWNVDFDDTPAPFFELKCRDKTVVGTEFKPDPDKKGGILSVAKGATDNLIWSPLDRITIRAGASKYYGLQEEDWVHNRYASSAGIIDLFNRHPLEKLGGADPGLSAISIIFDDEIEVVQSGEKTQKLEFGDYVYLTRPRVIDKVPRQLALPRTIAADLFLTHDPRCYRWAGMLYEDLYRSDQNMAHLARGATAYFRSFCFDRVTKLVSTLEVLGANEEQVDWPSGMGLAELKTLADVSNAAEEIKRNSPSFNALIRCILHLQASKRLKYVSTQVDDHPFTVQELSRWRESLSMLVANEMNRLNEVDNGTIKQFVQSQLAMISDDLAALASRN